jgi:aminoglycoside 3-N-acetyltransferase
MGGLSALGITPGMTLIVHSSLSALGWVNGGPQAVVLALENVLGPSGTLVMPTHSAGLSDPAMLRETMPTFDPDLTPTHDMGAIPECFRKQKGVLRSSHPQVSFAAWGAHAAFVTDNHTLEFGLGDGSPLARIYDLDGWVLLLGVGHANNTSIHLAEFRAEFPGKPFITSGAPILCEGARQWTQFQDLDWEANDFPLIGEAFGAERRWVRAGQVAHAPSLLMPQRPLVDYAVSWMEKNRR